ncbi:hypothetical protein C1T17_16455 [Sphingobium sp. SCG-1]|uniref:hypothetical protein n=1 Tax=Sphingobium sp. SCG-1 TaxID=2072936 RepID=UPI000CD6BCF7|nr:hypothetical protein [Sphingobium sp. SCG-1]AUW59442.1 hypothetical protein C1T17_16455 [Sphingobium sp. SCG-1]
MAKAYITKHSVGRRDVPATSSGNIIAALPGHVGNSIDLDFSLGEQHTADLGAGLYELSIDGDNARIAVGAGAVATQANGKFWFDGRVGMIFVREGQRISVLAAI